MCRCLALNLHGILQVVCDFQGRPLFVSGPHVGVRSDIRLWRECGPVLLAGENVLGDKAYVSADVPTVLAPYKKTDGGSLSLEQRDFNIVHRYDYVPCSCT